MRLRNTATSFSGLTSETFFQTWQISNWEVADRVQLDEFGHHPDHDDYQIDVRDDYTDELPDDKRNIVAAMRYAEAWMIPMDTILDMPYVEFYERTMVHKALKLTRPVWVGKQGEMVFVAEKSTSRRFDRRRYRRKRT